MQYIPSYYLVDTLHRVINYGASWNDVMPNLLTLFIIGIGTLIIGSVVLRRRFQ
jgi:ABC-type multidrug transport system permease subunit